MIKFAPGKNPRAHCIPNLFCSFGLLYQAGESGRIRDSDLREHLAVKLNVRFLQAIHKAGVIHTVCTAGRRNTGDPQAAEIALSVFTADISIIAGFHNGLFGHLKMFALSTIIALCEL